MLQLSVGINGNNPGSGQTGQSQSERARAGSGFGDGSAIPAVPGGPRYQQPSYPQQSQQPSTGSQNSYLDIIRGSAQPAYAGNPNVNQNGLQGLEGGVQGLTLQVPNSSGKSDVQLQDDPASPAFIMPMPDVPKSFPELEKLTDLQLERMLRDEVALEVNPFRNVCKYSVYFNFLADEGK